ncbi:anion permease [Thermogymnomonas acidicola]|uniref:Probable membrane transporter protein n=2 Tax=Thermogymnomonas acidicola TaxID=399579 RepID=A0AA37F9E4_9ARCH|nr:anion permease [Thermogymnomonas acidicola]
MMLTYIGAIIRFISIVAGGIFAGLLGSLTGLGGGTVLVPLLTIFYGVPIIFATGASLVSTIATSAGSASAYTRDRITNVKVGVGLEVATTLGAIFGSILAVDIYRHSLQWVIYIVFGIVLLFSLIPTIKKGKYEIPQKMDPDWTTRVFQLSGSYYDARLKKRVDYNGVRWWLGEIIMFFAGTISGLLGIGSGALKVLGMDWAMNLPMKVTTTTSNFMIGITAATGSSIYWYEGYIQVFIAAATAIGVLTGAFIGAKILVRMTNKNIRWIFFGVLSFLGVEMVLKGLYIRDIISIATLIQFIISVVFAIVMILGLYLSNTRGQRKEVTT